MGFQTLWECCTILPSNYVILNVIHHHQNSFNSIKTMSGIWYLPRFTRECCVVSWVSYSKCVECWKCMYMRK
jgi:hypothetical protein